MKDTAPLEDPAGFHSPLLPQGLQVEVQNLKDQVQELHRDLTKHHSLIKAEIMGDILHRSLLLDTQIASEYASMEGMRAVFQEVTPPPPEFYLASCKGTWPPQGRKGTAQCLTWRSARPSRCGFCSWRNVDQIGVCGCTAPGAETLSVKFLLPTSTSTPLFFQIWEDSYQRVATQQEIYEGPRQWLLNVNPHSRGEGAGQALTAHAYLLLSSPPPPPPQRFSRLSHLLWRVAASEWGLHTTRCSF